MNKQKLKEAVEGLEFSRRLAKQVLSQLSYTPIVKDTPILRHFCNRPLLQSLFVSMFRSARV